MIVSKTGIHCVGPRRSGYDEFLERIATAGRKLSVVKVRDDFGAIDQPLALWPDTLTIGAKTDYDGDYQDAELAYQRIVAIKASKPGLRYVEYLNEIDGEYSAQADLYIALLPRLAKFSIGLCIFNCASGTPRYPAEDETPYREIARACKFAKDNGYDALLGLHEYWTDTPHTIGRYRILADYLAARNALIPIVITEWLYETHPGDIQFMAGVRENDPVYMADPRVLGCAAWTLGGGGWQGSNYESALPQLGEYIATIGDQTVSLMFGVHATASPGPMLAGDVDGIWAAKKFNSYKFLTGDPPEHYAQITALGIPIVNCLTRLFVDFSNRPKPTAAQFCDEQRLAIQEAMTAGVMWFEIHNEPNLPQEWPYSTDPHDFITWCLQVVAQLRANHPGIQLVSPGLSPQPNTPQWWNDFAEHGIFSACDAIGAHVYWPDRETMLTLAQGLNFIPLEQYASISKPIFITEFSNNKIASTDFEKGAEYVDWAAYIQANHPLVTQAYLYILSSGSDSDNDTRQAIVRSGVVSQIANGIAETTPAPGTTWAFEHYHIDGGAAVTDNPITIIMDRAHTLIVNAVEISTGRFLLSITIDPPQARVEVILTPPQPAEGYLIGQSVSIFTRPLP